MVYEPVEFVKLETKDYPMEMYLVPDREKYSLIKIGNVLFVPLHQAFDAMAGFRPNEEWRNGVRFCPNCRREWGDDGGAPKRTNADRIRAKTNEQLAEWIMQKTSGYGYNGYDDEVKAWLEWQEQEADGDIV